LTLCVALLISARSSTYANVREKLQKRWILGKDEVGGSIPLKSSSYSKF